MQHIYRSVAERSDSAAEWEKRSDRYKTGAGTEVVAVVEVEHL